MTRQRCGSTRRWRRVLGFVAALGSLVVGGCDGGNEFALSLQPFFAPADLETDQALPGVWATKEGDVTFTFEQGEGKEYKLVVKETDGGEGTTSEFEAHLVRLGSCMFLDFLPSRASGASFTRCTCSAPTRLPESSFPRTRCRWRSLMDRG